MADENIEDGSSPTSHPFFIRNGFPFVFLPTTFATGFAGANNQTRVSTNDNQTNAESGKKGNEDNSVQAEKKEEGEEAKSKSDNDDDDANDETNSDNENNDKSNDLSDLRISQPKYSQLLKDLDFSKARMVDVTNLLTDELEQQSDDVLSPDENESPEKILDKNQYDSASEISDNEDESSAPAPKNKTKNKTDDERAQERVQLMEAANEIQNDLNDLAAILQAAAASQHSGEQDEEDEDDEDQNKRNLQKRPTIDEDDDTSKQATQNYDYNDFEQETIPSPISNKFSRLISQENTDEILDKSQPSIDNLDVDVNKSDENPSQTEEQEKQQQPILNWDSLVNGLEPQGQPSNDSVLPQPIHQPEITPKRFTAQNPPDLSKDTIKPQTNSVTQPKVLPRAYQVTSSSSSSDTDSVVQYAIHHSNQIRVSPPMTDEPMQTIFRPETVWEDSQGMLIDENLEDLNSQRKLGRHSHEQRQKQNLDTREERPVDGVARKPTRLPSAERLPPSRLDREENNPPQRSSSQHTHQSSTQHRYPTDIPEYANPQKTAAYQQQRYTTSRINEQNINGNSRRGNDDWLSMLERLEREHKVRLEKQQQEYEDYVHTLEESMKRRFDDYLTLSNGFQEPKLDGHEETAYPYHAPSSIPVDSNIGRSGTNSRCHAHRTFPKDLISHYYPADSTLNVLASDSKRTMGANDIPRTKSREDNNSQADILAKHAKHIADLKLYYEYEINELKNQLNRLKMGNTSSNTRQTMEIIERINNENIRLNDEVHDLRHSLKTVEEDNAAMKKQLEDLRSELHKKDNDIKNYHQTVFNLEKKLTEAENTTEIQDEKLRHADRQALFYREENEKIKTDLNLTRERLLRLEERYHEQENENEALRQQLFMYENDNNRARSRATVEHKPPSTMVLNEPTSKEYGRFAVSNVRHTSPTVTAARDTKLESRRYPANDIEVTIRHAHSPRPMTRISDYLNDKPVFPEPYVPPTRNSYSPRRMSPDRRRTDPIPNRVHTSLDRQSRQSEYLEQKFDQLLRKKRELETRMNRIPLRGLTKTDRQLYEVLEREIERVEQQIASVKLELRKLTILRTH